MDGKRNPSSFQQLEKLGEGTYATVSSPISFIFHALNTLRSSKAGIAKPASSLR